MDNLNRRVCYIISPVNEILFYPAETYRKFGFKDVRNVYYYIENS